jgi:REP element-mobilizing transposase RayT
MSRPLRVEYPGAIYHVTSRGNARQPIFGDDEDREMLLSVFAEVVARFNFFCHAYCLMDNHYHFVIETPEANLSQGMRQLNGFSPSASIGGITAWDISYRDGSRRSSSSAILTYWSFAGMWL